MLGALTVGGIVPDPLLPERQPLFYWGIIFSLVLGNILLFVFGLGFAGLWAKMARIPFRLLWPFILLLCLTGSYLETDGISGPIQCMFFGIAAVFLKRNGYPVPPLILAFVLGPRLETHVIQTWLAFF